MVLKIYPSMKRYFQVVLMANQIWFVKLRRAKWRHVQITQQPNARK